VPIQKPCAFINARSGSTSDITGPLTEKLKSKFDTIGPVKYAEPEKMAEMMDAAIEDDCDLIIIYGGDGSALSAAEMAREKNIPIVALPGGTMNLLPKTLYDTLDWDEALDTALACEKPRWMAAGDVNGETFLCGCIIGTPTRLNEVREQIRDKHFKEAAEDLIYNVMNFKSENVFEYGLGRSPKTYLEANLLHVVCPQMSDFKTGRGGMEINALDVNSIFDVAGLGLSAIASDWRENDHAETNISNELHIKGTGKIDILLDGESRPMKLPLHLKLFRKGVLVLAPN